MIRKEIKIIKEHVVNEKNKTIHFIIRTKLYDDSVQYWLDLVEIAKQDFPKLDLSKVKSVVYGGDSYKGTRGIEFLIGEPFKILDEYVNGFILEYTL